MFPVLVAGRVGDGFGGLSFPFPLSRYSGGPTLFG